MKLSLNVSKWIIFILIKLKKYSLKSSKTSFYNFFGGDFDENNKNGQVYRTSIYKKIQRQLYKTYQRQRQT